MADIKKTFLANIIGQKFTNIENKVENNLLGLKF